MALTGFRFEHLVPSIKYYFEGCGALRKWKPLAEVGV